MKTLFLSMFFLTITVWAQNPTATTGASEPLVINWEQVQTRYNFKSLSQEDRAELLNDLGPSDRETLSERSARLKIIEPGNRMVAEDSTTVSEAPPKRVKKSKFMVKFEKKF